MTQTPDPHADLAGQRAALESQLADLGNLNGVPLELIHQARAAIDARRAEMDEVQQQIDELDAITGARAKQERAAAERTRLDRMEALRAQIVGLSEQRLAAIAEAEASARQLANSLLRAIEANAAMARAAYTLTGESTPIQFSDNELVRRLSARLSAVMSSGLGKLHRFRFGLIEWKGSSNYAANQDWAEAEERLVAPAIVQIIEPKDH